MEFSTDLPKYRFSACLFSIWLCANWPQAAYAACTLIPTAGNDNFVCDSATSGPLTDLSGNNTLTFPANGTGRINGNVTFGTGADTVTIASGTVAGALSQGNGIDDFVMSGGTVQSLAQGDGRDTFLMTGGTIVGAFEDGDVARMTGGSIGRVDMKLDNNLFEMSGGQILRNLVTGLGTDTIIVSRGRIGGNISVSNGNDSITVTGGEIVGEIRAGNGDDTLVWDGDGIIRSQILLEAGNDSATLRNSIIGPNVSIAPGSRVENSIVRDSIIHDDAVVENVLLEASVVGNRATVHGRCVRLNVGDSTELDFN